jgi:hypothetical protein
LALPVCRDLNVINNSFGSPKSKGGSASYLPTRALQAKTPPLQSFALLICGQLLRFLCQ